MTFMTRKSPFGLRIRINLCCKLFNVCLQNIDEVQYKYYVQIRLQHFENFSIKRANKTEPI